MKKQVAGLLAILMLFAMVPAVSIPTYAADGNVMVSVPWEKINDCGHQTYSGPCQAYCWAYCRIILDNMPHTYYDYWTGTQATAPSAAGYTSQSVNMKTKQMLLETICNNVDLGCPVVVGVNGTPGSAHFVVAIGYKAGCDRSRLSESDILVLDPASNRINAANGANETYIYLNSYTLTYITSTNNYVCWTTSNSYPTGLIISTDKNSYSLGETVAITPSANNATHYAISVWRGSFGTGERLYANFNLSGGTTFVPRQTGKYTIRMDAKNSLGYISAERTFTVTQTVTQPNALPTNLTISTDKSAYTIGETVAITPASNNATYYAISIWRGSFGTGERLYANFNLSGGTTFVPQRAGTYTIRMDAKNSAGYISAEKTFTVNPPSTLPTNPTISIEKNNYTLNETVAITPSADNATHYAISIWRGAFNTGERLYVDYHLYSGITFRPTQAGTYTIRMDAKNSSGYTSTEKTFTVVSSNSLPTDLTVYTDKYTYSLGETVTITPAANNVTHYAISVWRGAFSTGERLYVNYHLSEGITFKPTQSGMYTIRVDAKNGAGYISTEKIFVVE